MILTRKETKANVFQLLWLSESVRLGKSQKQQRCQPGRLLATGKRDPTTLSVSVFHPQIRGTNFPNILWPLVSGFASTSTWRCVFEHLVRFERRDTETADRSDRPEISKALTETVESSKILRQSRKTRVHCLKATSLQPKQKHQAEIHHHTYR